MSAQVITFYSYKGGVGRTFALANVAALMAKVGHRVLCVDWDLEAPGLHRYFDDYRDTAPSDGLLEWVLAHVEGKRLDWRGHVQTLRFDDHDVAGQLDLMAAGRLDADYVRWVQTVDWTALYDDHDFGQSLETMRREWVEAYDYVLVDSRTGISDIGGICAAQLPDILVFLTTANRQSLDGVLDAVDRAAKQREQLPVPRGKFLTVPLPSRFDDREEYKQGERWLEVFAERLAPYYRPWLDANATPRDMLDVLRVPYLSYWSFDERIAVLDERLQDSKNISYSLAMLTALLLNGLRDSHELARDPKRYLSGALRLHSTDASATGTTYDFYVLYASPDRHTAQRLVDRLRAGGASVWVDLDLLPGDLWEEETSRAILLSRNVAVLVSRWWEGRDAHELEHVTHELAQLRQLERHRVIPVYIDHPEGRLLPSSLSERVGTHIDGDDVDDAVRDLLRLVPSGDGPVPSSSRHRHH